MNTFSNMLKSVKSGMTGKMIDLPDHCINQIGSNELEEYLTKAKNFLSEASRFIIKYMIENNESYVENLGGQGSTNCIKDFYAKKKPEDATLAKIYDYITELNKNGRILEIPTLLTTKQFRDILAEKISPDSIILDLKSDNGRQRCIAQYEKLLEKVVHQWIGKVNMDEDEIRSAALEGFTFAMNEYGKKRKMDMTDEEAEAVRSYTFGQYAAYMMRFSITGAANNTSRLVRIPISAIGREKKEKGSIAKTNTVSGDKKVGDDENSKSLFDFIGDVDSSERNIDQEDLDKLWSEVYSILEHEFDKKVIEAWYSFQGLNGREKLKNKEIAERVGCKPANITYYCNTVNNFIKNTPKLMKKFTEIHELMKECLHERDHDNDLIEDGLNANDIRSMNKNNNDDD